MKQWFQFAESRAAFRHRPFRLYWSAQLVSLMGTFMQQVALGYLVYAITGSKWLLGIVAVLQMGPSLILGLPAGVIADRVQRKQLMLVTQSTALVLAFCLATLTAINQLQVWEILVISTISGIAIAMEAPARQAIVVELVGKEDLSNAIGWNTLVVSGARVVGPAVGGVVVRFLGVAPVFYYNSFSFLAMIVALLLMHLPNITTADHRHPLAELAEGLTYLRRTPAIMLIIALTAVVSLLIMNFAVLLPIYARDVLHVGADGLGWEWTAMGVGAVVGSITVVRWSQAALGGRFLLAAAVIAGLGNIGMALSRALTPSILALLVIGWATGAFLASANSSVQHRVDDAVRGRVLGLYTLIFIGSGPIGGLLSAWLANIGGAPLALFVSGILCLGFAALVSPAFLRGLPAARPLVGAPAPQPR